MPFLSFSRYLRITAAEAGVHAGPWTEEQRGDYESGLVSMHDGVWRLRTARVTPTKPGAFVAVWERGEDGITRPFQPDESVRGLMVFIEDGDRFGVFRFTSEDLDRLGVTSSDGRPGKRGFRLYPEWCSGLNPAALRTQRAQVPCFTVLM